MITFIKRIFTKDAGWRCVLSGSAGILLGASFPPSPLSSLAYIAFIPLFWMIDENKKNDSIMRQLYLFLFVFHVSTLYWAGGFIPAKDVWMMAAGAALLLIHPFFYLPFLWLSLYVRKNLGRIAGFISFALLWITFDYLHSLSEYSFPWLSLGNSQSYDANRIQIAEYTSVYGLSFIIFTCNILAYEITRNIAFRRWLWNSAKLHTTIGCLLLVYILPSAYGIITIKKLHPSSAGTTGALNIGVIQPNVDPWEKWGLDPSDRIQSYFQQMSLHITETKKLAKFKPDLILWSETAIPFYIFMPRYGDLLHYMQTQIDSAGVPVLTGVPTVKYFDSSDAPAAAERIGNSDLYVEAYNSVTMFLPKSRPGPIYRKIVLVPFAERIPYADEFKFLIKPLRWNVGISGWGKGTDTIIYTLRCKDTTQVRFAGIICYESIYPNFVRAFVDRGAEFLVIVTNDSWWGRTSGAYQHAAFASLRAVETRRWVVQAANGGISELVDLCGIVQSKTKLYSRTSVLMQLHPESVRTFYVNYGDVFAQMCSVTALIVVGVAAGQHVRRKRDKR
ncbi:MAG: apolipoprotein N-acyltransferase [Bacteroidota bacterium]